MNFEEISRKFKKIGKDTVTEVQKLNEVRQLNVRINDEKKRMTRVYTEMGKRLYDLYKDAPLEGFEADMQSIEEGFRLIDLLQDQIRNVKGVTLCPCCNMEVDATERFCSNCGNKMPEVITVDDAEETDAVIETEGVVEVEDLAAEAEAMEAEFDAADAEAAEGEVVEAAETAEAEVVEEAEAAEAEVVEEAETAEDETVEAEVVEAAEAEVVEEAETEEEK